MSADEYRRGQLMMMAVFRPLIEAERAELVEVLARTAQAEEVTE